MAVRISQWRAGVAHLNPGSQLVTLPRVLLLHLFPSKRLLVVMYCYVPCMTIPSRVILANYLQVLVQGFAVAYLLFYIIASSNKSPLNYFSKLGFVRKQLFWKAKLLLYGIECLDFSVYFYSHLLISLSDDIELNPGPNRNGSLKFCHWNLNSISAREQVKNSHYRGIQFSSSL